MDTIAYLDAVKARYHWESDYKLAKELGMSKSRISGYRCGKSSMDESACIKVAKLLNIDPAPVLLDAIAERTKCDQAARILRKTAKQLTSAAASLFLTIVMLNAFLYPADSMAGGADQVTSNVYYVKWLMQWISTSPETKTLFFVLFIANNLILHGLLHLRKSLKSR